MADEVRRKRVVEEEQEEEEDDEVIGPMPAQEPKPKKKKGIEWKMILIQGLESTKRSVYNCKLDLQHQTSS
jgi:peptidylprolyl isomerase domain and WD repeat-containing protein 1